MTRGNGTFEYSYDGNHNVTGVSNDDLSMSIERDNNGNATSTELSATGYTKTMSTAATYDAKGNLLMSQTDARGLATTYTYANSFNKLSAQPSSVKNARNVTTSYTYDTSSGRRTGMTRGTGVLSYGYTNGRLTQITRTGAGSQSYNMAYDAYGNVSSVKVGTRTLASYAYGTKNGPLSTLTYGNGNSVSYVYDPLERVTGVRYNGSSSNALSYTYWGDGGVNTLTDTPNGRSYSYNYDSRGRLKRQLEQYGGNTVRSYDATYDTADRQTKATYKVSPDWSGTLNGQRTYTWQYAGGDGSLTKFTFPSTTTSCLTYTYDALKRLTKRTTTVTGTLRGSKEYSYLAGSGTNGTTTLVSQLKNKDGSGNVTQSYTYTYDNVGNILTVSGSSSESYTYDTHDKLKKAVVNGVTYTYTYDVNGNILSKSDGTTTDAYAYGNSVWVDLLTAYNGHAITYDTPGNPTSWYDGAAMSWVNGRRLASIGATSAHGAMSFTYDADGLRLTKTVGGVEHRYLWQNGKLVSEAWGDKYLEFFYDEKGVPLSFLYRSSATADVWKYLYVTNLQGDVIGITTPDGESRAVYTYDPFGKPLTATGAMASINPLRYRGYYYDKESGLYYLKSRYYDPGICRFINADSFASTGQSIVGCNMFAYCNDNPIVCYDPDGSKLWYIDANGDAKPSEIPYYKDFDLIIYYYNTNSSMNLDNQALNQGYSSRAKYVPVGSFTELTNALKDVPIGTRNIYLYLHSDPGHLTFYYKLHVYSRQIIDDVPRVSISGDIFLFSCHGASFARGFAIATGQTVIATNEGVSFNFGYARYSPSDLVEDYKNSVSCFWQAFRPDGLVDLYSRFPFLF